MGELLSRYKFDKDDPKISSLSHIHSRDIDEALRYYIDEYPNILRVKLCHFDDIFGDVLHDVERRFRFFCGPEKPDADLLEIFAVLIIACKGNITWKVKMLLCLFDFDNSENIDKNEISLVISVFTRALSKLGTGSPPSNSKLFILANSIFKEIDKDSSSILEFQEILEWSDKKKELQEIMANFSQIQSLEQAQMRFEKAFSPIEEIYIPVTVTRTLMQDLEQTMLSQLSVEELGLFFSICMTTGSINPIKFQSYARGVIAFLVSDYTLQKSIDKQEIQIMLSLISRQEKKLTIVEEFMSKALVPTHGRLSFRYWIDILSNNKKMKEHNIRLLG